MNWKDVIKRCADDVFTYLAKIDRLEINEDHKVQDAHDALRKEMERHLMRVPMKAEQYHSECMMALRDWGDEWLALVPGNKYKELESVVGLQTEKLSSYKSAIDGDRVRERQIVETRHRKHIVESFPARITTILKERADFWKYAEVRMPDEKRFRAFEELIRRQCKILQKELRHSPDEDEASDRVGESIKQFVEEALTSMLLKQGAQPYGLNLLFTQKDVLQVSQWNDDSEQTRETMLGGAIEQLARTMIELAPERKAQSFAEEVVSTYMDHDTTFEDLLADTIRGSFDSLIGNAGGRHPSETQMDELSLLADQLAALPSTGSSRVDFRARRTQFIKDLRDAKVDETLSRIGGVTIPYDDVLFELENAIEVEHRKWEKESQQDRGNEGVGM